MESWYVWGIGLFVMSCATLHRGLPFSVSQFQNNTEKGSSSFLLPRLLPFPSFRPFTPSSLPARPALPRHPANRPSLRLLLLFLPFSPRPGPVLLGVSVVTEDTPV